MYLIISIMLTLKLPKLTCCPIIALLLKHFSFLLPVAGDYFYTKPFPTAFDDSSASRCVKTSNLFFSVETDTRLWLPEVPQWVLRSHSADISQLHTSTSHEKKWLYFGMTSGQEGWCKFSSVQGKHLEALQQRSDPRHTTTGIMPG